MPQNFAHHNLQEVVFPRGGIGKGLHKHGINRQPNNNKNASTAACWVEGWDQKGWLLHALRPVLDVVTFCGAFKQPVQPVRQSIQQVLLEKNAAIHV